MRHIPDMVDLYDQYEAEQERFRKFGEREECDLPFVEVPQDNGRYKELY